MNVFLGPKALPPVLARNGVQVWVGDSVPKDGTLKAKHHHFVSTFLYKDLDGEIVVIFMAKDPSAADSNLLRHCRRWASQMVCALLA